MGAKPAVVRKHQTTYEEMADRGINAANVPTALAQFDAYKAEVTACFSNFKESITKYQSAFFGEHSAAVKSYVDSVMDSAANLLHQLEQFGPQLEEASAKYAQQDTALSGDLSSAASTSSN